MDQETTTNFDNLSGSSDEGFENGSLHNRFPHFRDDCNNMFDADDFFTSEKFESSSTVSVLNQNSGDILDDWQLFSGWDNHLNCSSISEEIAMMNENYESKVSFSPNNGIGVNTDLFIGSQLSNGEEFNLDSLPDMEDVQQQIFLDDVNQNEIQPNDIYVPLDGESLQKELISNLTIVGYEKIDAASQHAIIEAKKAEVSLCERHSFSLIISTQNVKGGEGCPGCNTQTKKKKVRFDLSKEKYCEGRKGTPCQLTQFLHTLASFGIGRKAVVRRCGDLDAKGHNSSGLRSTHTLTRLHLPTKVRVCDHPMTAPAVGIDDREELD